MSEDTVTQPDHARLDTESSVETPGEGTLDDGSAASGSGSRRRVPLVLVAAIVTAMLTGGVVWWTQRGLPEDAVFRFGDRTVTVDDLRERQSAFRAMYGIEAPTGGQELEDYQRDSAKSVAVGLVLESAARERGVTVSSGDVDSTLAAYLDQFYGQGEEARARFLAALGQAGAGEDDVREEISRQLLVARLYADVVADVPVPDDAAVEAAFTDRRCDLRIPEQRLIRNIVVPTRQEAFAVKIGLQRGADFADVVVRRSIDQASRDDGGSLGRVSLSDLEDGYGRAAFSVPQGAVFGPVQSQYGWNVGQVQRVFAPRQASFAATRDPLREKLLDEARTARWRSWLEQQLTDADIDYAEAYRPADPTAPPAVGTGPTGSAGPTGADGADGTSVPGCGS